MDIKLRPIPIAMVAVRSTALRRGTALRPSSPYYDRRSDWSYLDAYGTVQRSVWRPARVLLHTASNYGIYAIDTERAAVTTVGNVLPLYRGPPHTGLASWKQCRRAFGQLVDGLVLSYEATFERTSKRSLLLSSIPIYPGAMFWLSRKTLSGS